MNTQIIHQNQTNELALMGNSLTMSSREIAELTEKRHDHVMSDIRKMLTELNVNAPDFSGTYKTAQGNEYQCFHLPKRETLILVSGYSIELRARIIDRWQELEMQSKLGFNPNDEIQVLEYALEQKKANRALQIELNEAKPAVQFVEKYVDGSGLMRFRQVCKTLKAKENAFREFLLEKKIMYRLNGQLTAYSHHIDADRFTVKTGINGHNGHAFADTMFTPKGVNWIAGEWAKHQIQGEL